MPELPEVEKLTRQLRAALVGRSAKNFEWREGAQKHCRNFPLDDFYTHFASGVTDVTRIGKNLIFHFQLGAIVQWHLNSTGWFYADNAHAAAQAIDPIYKAFITFTRADHPPRFALELSDGQRWVYRDQRTWGRGYLWRTRDPLDGTAGDLHLYGHDWLYARDAAIERLVNWRPQSPRRVKEVLLDQRITTGIGNWICIEALHRAAIYPYASWNTLTLLDKTRIADAVAHLIDVALATPDYSYWQVFSRRDQWCLRPECTGIIRYQKDGPNALRGSYYCDRCQTPHAT